MDVARVLVSLSAETCAFPPTEELVEPSQWFATPKNECTSSERQTGKSCWHMYCCRLDPFILHNNLFYLRTHKHKWTHALTHTHTHVEVLLIYTHTNILAYLLNLLLTLFYISSTDLLSTSPLPLTASPRAARTGPVKTGGRIFVLDHGRWTQPMRDAIDLLLAKHHGKKDMLKQVDFEYAALVHRSCKDPNSLLHPTTRQHISLYVKHLAKLINTSSSLNTSPEKLLETQQLWQHLTEGSETVSVPVTAVKPAPVNPPVVSPSQDAPLTQATLVTMVKEIVERQLEAQRL